MTAFDPEQTLDLVDDLRSQNMARCRLISNSKQQTFNADVFVKFIPVKTSTSSADFIFGPLFLSRMKKSGEIGHGDTQTTSVG